MGRSRRVSVRALGWLGRLLRFEGVIEDGRQPISIAEFDELVALYGVEAEEREEREAEVRSQMQ